MQNRSITIFELAVASCQIRVSSLLGRRVTKEGLSRKRSLNFQKHKNRFTMGNYQRKTGGWHMPSRGPPRCAIFWNAY